ncbi:MAG: hypothetical protein J0H74_12130 [Chitinophagaceae bacterium]|nr:hypothetical protein [Chitinophagaceae bacterium]
MNKKLLNLLLMLTAVAGACAQQGVGIGTTATFARLQVGGISSAAYPMLALQDSGTNSFPQIYLGNSNHLLNWNVGGAITGNAPTDFFNISYGGVPFYSTYFSINGNGQIGVAGTTSQNNWLQIGNVPSIFSGNGLAIGTGSQAMSFAQYPSTSTWYSNTSFSLMPNTGNGYLGVGTQAPAAAVHVYSPSTTAVPNILAEQSNADFSRLMFKNSNGNSFTVAASNGGGSGTDNFNIFSNSLGTNLVNITTQSIVPSQPTGSINLNGITDMNQATVLKYALATFADGTVNDNWLLPNSTLVYLQDDGSSTSPITVTGFAGGVAGRVVVCYNAVVRPITLKNADSRSAFVNQFSISGDLTLQFGDIVTLIYLQGHWSLLSKNF